MSKVPENISIMDDRIFQMKLMKFKKNWLASRNGSTSNQNQIIFKDIPDRNKTRAKTESSIKLSGKRVRRKTTINPGGIIKKKDSLSRCPIGKYEKTFGQYSTITVESKVTEASLNLNTSKKMFRSQHNSKQTFQKKKKYRRKRSKCHERGCENSSSSECSNNFVVTKSKASRNYTILNDDNSVTKNENTSIKNSLEQSSFRLRSPILFRNADKRECTNKFAQSSVTLTTADIEIESGGFTSSEGSFSFRKFEWGSHSVRSRKLQNHQQTSDSWKNNDLPVHDNRSENQQNVLSWLRSLERSKSDISKFSDDNENSVTFSLKYNKRVAANALVEKNYARNIEMEISNSAALTVGSSCNKNRRSNFSPDFVGKVPGMNHEKRPLSRKKPMQWYDMPDSLESSLSTSKEKLNEIKGLF